MKIKLLVRILLATYLHRGSVPGRPRAFLVNAHCLHALTPSAARQRPCRGFSWTRRRRFDSERCASDNLSAAATTRELRRRRLTGTDRRGTHAAGSSRQPAATSSSLPFRFFRALRRPEIMSPPEGREAPRRGPLKSNTRRGAIYRVEN